jgi:hypothetical protein
MRYLLIVLAILGFASDAAGQQEKKKKAKDEFPTQEELRPHEAAQLFREEEPIKFVLIANFGRLRHDRTQNPPWRAARISYEESPGKSVEVPVRVRTRGIWRLKECDMPPLRFDFKKDSVKGTLFAKLDKPKLVTHCKDSKEGDQLILSELQLYRIYNLLTSYSHRVRLAQVAYADSGSGKVETTRYAFLEEEPAAVAHRVGAMLVKQQGATAGDLVPSAAVLFGVFQYFIGNTDWSIAGLHNAELVTADSLHVPIPYDFDFSGAVNARYATTDPRLPIHRVRERLYRGYCMPNDDELFPSVFAIFQSKKDSIYALYHDPIGRLLDEDRAKETLEYYDEFYRTIGDPKDAKREIEDRCINRPGAS